MKCPRCSSEVKKRGVSRYCCDFCRQWWLIQKLTTYPPPDDFDIGHGIIDPRKIEEVSK